MNIREQISHTKLTTAGPGGFKLHAFTSMLQHHLGNEKWLKLERSIRDRFTPKTNKQQDFRFTGIMQWIYCSPMGRLIAQFIRPFSILPTICARDTPFEFNIFARDGILRKQRHYKLDNSEKFTFTSLFSNRPRLHEEFRGGIGMYLELAESQGALLFRDNGYFIRFGSKRIRLPRWLTVGYFDLLHRNIDQHRFQVIIRVTHPIFGTLFYQRGEFRTVRPQTWNLRHL